MDGRQLTLLDLFAGIGGFSLAAHRLGIKTTQFVEINPYCQQVLRKNFCFVPIHDDITTFTATRGQFDIITAGFPCQDISFANPNGQGLDGKRSGLFFEIIRLLRLVQPKFLVLENVTALLNKGMDRVLWEIAQSGYDAEWQTISASSMGAPHRRERIFIIAYPTSTRLKAQHLKCQKSTKSKSANAVNSSLAPHTQSDRTSRALKTKQTRAAETLGSYTSFWQQNPHPEPTICRLDAGLPRGLAVKQLKALGNTVVPQCAAVPLQRVLHLNSLLEAASFSTA